MCTAVSYKTQNTYFGRNLDLEYSYSEYVCVTPRKFPLSFRHRDTLTHHHAFIGMAHIENGYPLYYDAVNEKGLAIAGLRFTDSAPYAKDAAGIASFELIPFLLSSCSSLDEVKHALHSIKITDDHFSQSLKNTPLHWMAADNTGSVVLEWSENGLNIFDNPTGVLTNNPSFDRQIQTSFPLLPGGLSSEERFVRAAHVLKNSVSGTSEAESISQFFHILGSVTQVRGCNVTDEGLEITVYSSCMNLSRGIYYYKTYENSRITAVCLQGAELDSRDLITFPLRTAQDIRREN
ncbi:MAG: linear amide C-N hydrolase [Oscillospiraceae bacterium]|nr:linear amide C-N hydrolase [Oscillospiraceae bacterium]